MKLFDPMQYSLMKSSRYFTRGLRIFSDIFTCRVCRIRTYVVQSSCDHTEWNQYSITALSLHQVHTGYLAIKI